MKIIISTVFYMDAVRILARLKMMSLRYFQYLDHGDLILMGLQTF